MFMAMSRFVIANGLEEDVRQAFAHRPHLVEEVPGFVPHGCPLAHRGVERVLADDVLD